MCKGRLEPGRKQVTRLSTLGLLAILMWWLAACSGVSGGRVAPIATATPATSNVPDQTPTGATRRVVATVNGQPIYRDVYDKQVTQLEQALRAQGNLAEGEQGEAQLARIREDVLNSLIEQVLIEQAASQMQITVTDQELDESLELVTGQGSLDDWLAQNNLTREELRAMQRAQLLTNKLVEVVSAWVATSAEQVHARHILSADENKVQRLLERLRAGEKFAALAQQESEDRSTATNGGDLGWFPRDIPLMPSAVIEAAFSLQPGEVSGVVHSEMGYHIVKVEAREVSRPLAPDILLYLRQRAFKQWLAEQRSKATIQRYTD